MATWDVTIRNALANAIDDQVNSGGGTANITFYTAASATVCTCALSATAWGNAVSGVLASNTIASGTATATQTIGYAQAFNKGGTTVGSFVCSTAGTVDFVFGALSVVSGDTITVSTWSVTVSAS